MSAIKEITTMLESMALKKPDDNKKPLKEQNTAKKTSEDLVTDKKASEEQETAKKTSEEQDTDKKASEYDPSASKHCISNVFLGLPDEVLLNIGSNLSAADNGNIRLVNKRLSYPFRESFFKALASEFTFYPRYESFSGFFSLIESDVIKARHVTKIVVVRDGLVAPKNDYGWYWEELEEAMGSYFTVADWDIIRDINNAHRCDIHSNGSFLTGGGYRAALASLFMQLPNLETIEVRHLYVGEHLPGWDGLKLMKELSLYHDKLYDRNMFYGDWKYDEVQMRVTEYIDEFGELVTELGAGPQATFTDDLERAYLASRTQAVIVY